MDMSLSTFSVGVGVLIFWGVLHEVARVVCCHMQFSFMYQSPLQIFFFAGNHKLNGVIFGFKEMKKTHRIKHPGEGPSLKEQYRNVPRE